MNKIGVILKINIKSAILIMNNFGAKNCTLLTALAIFVKTTVELPITKKLTDIFYKREKARQEAKHHAS